jgi:D-glycero-D-manno-heptose 1,7-bisphosphate phosphatase
MIPVPKLIILGRDGVLNEYRDDHVKEPDEWVPLPGALEAVARLNHDGWHVVLATNQSGIGSGMIDMATLNAVHSHMMKLLAKRGGRIDAVFFCPHAREEQCDCRKPGPGMMFDIARRYGVDLDRVPLVGDTERDILSAQASGCEPHLVLTGRSLHLDDARRRALLEQVPTTRVHTDLAACVEFLLHREHPNALDSGPGVLH